MSASCVEITSRLRHLLKTTPNEDWKQSAPLPEDRTLQSLAIFKVMCKGKALYHIRFLTNQRNIRANYDDFMNEVSNDGVEGGETTAAQ